MQNKLLLIGIVLTAVGLGTMAYFDPVVRILFFGTASLSSSGAAFRSAAAAGSFNFTRTSGSFSASSFAGRGALGGTSSITFVATLTAFSAAVVGLILTIASLAVSGRIGWRRSSAEPPSK